MKKVVVLVVMLCAGMALFGCSGGGSSSQTQSQQTQIATLQTQLSAVQTQLSSAKADGSVYNAGINTAIASLKQTESALATLAGRPANADTTPLTTAANQVLVLQSLAASLSSDTSALSTALASLTAQLAAANAQVTSLTAQLVASESTNSALSGQLAAANAQVTTLTGQIATLQSQLDNATNTIATRDATIVSLNNTITTLQAQISAMVATPVAMSASALTAAVSTTITVTATFPSSENGKTATFTATGGSLQTTPVTATIAGTTAQATFSSAAIGTFNIYVTEGLYAGGAIVTVTPTPVPTYTLSGTISLNGAGLQNVVVALTGDATAAALTDASGNYSFAGLQNGSYTVTPSLSGYSFQPTYRTVTISGANVTGQNFTDIITKTYSCSGTLSPLGRWCDNNDGTVRDMTTGLLWLKNAECADPLGGVTPGAGLTWQDASIWTSNIGNGSCGLNDGSLPGKWRLPSQWEFWTILIGTEAFSSSSPIFFSSVMPGHSYWSSTVGGPGISSDQAFVLFGDGSMSFATVTWFDIFRAWPVRQ